MKSTWTGIAEWNTDGFTESEEVDVEAESHIEARELIIHELTEGYQDGWHLRSVSRRSGGITVQSWK
jgi:hypothetical protein